MRVGEFLVKCDTPTTLVLNKSDDNMLVFAGETTEAIKRFKDKKIKRFRTWDEESIMITLKLGKDFLIDGEIKDEYQHYFREFNDIDDGTEV